MGISSSLSLLLALLFVAATLGSTAAAQRLTPSACNQIRGHRQRHNNTPQRRALKNDPLVPVVVDTNPPGVVESTFEATPTMSPEPNNNIANGENPINNNANGDNANNNNANKADQPANNVDDNNINNSVANNPGENPDPYNGFGGGGNNANQADAGSLWFVDLPDIVIRMGVIVATSTNRQGGGGQPRGDPIEGLVKTFLEGAMTGSGVYKGARMISLDAKMPRNQTYGDASGGSLMDISVAGEVGYQLDSKDAPLPLPSDQDLTDLTIQFFQSWKEQDLERYLEQNGVVGAAVTDAFVNGTTVTAKGKDNKPPPPKVDPNGANNANINANLNANAAATQGQGANAGLIIGLLLVCVVFIVVLVLLWTVREQVVSEVSRCCNSGKEKWVQARQGKQAWREAQLGKRGWRDFAKEDPNQSRDRSFSLDDRIRDNDRKQLNESAETSSQSSEDNRKWFGLAKWWKTPPFICGITDVNESTHVNPDDPQDGRKWLAIPKFFKASRGGREQPEDGILNRIQVLVDDDHSLRRTKAGSFSKTSAVRLRSMTSNQHSEATEPASNLPNNRRPNPNSQRRRFERPQAFVATDDVSPQKTVATIQSISPERSYEDSDMRMDDAEEGYLVTRITPAKSKGTTRTPSEIAQTWTQSTRSSAYTHSTEGTTPSTSSPTGIGSCSPWQPTPPMPPVEEEPPMNFCTTGMEGQVKKEESSTRPRASTKKAPEPPSATNTYESWTESFASFLNPCNPHLGLFREESERLDNIVANLPRNKSVFDAAANDTMEDDEEAESPRRAVRNDRPQHIKSKYGASRYENPHRRGDSYDNNIVRL